MISSESRLAAASSSPSDSPSLSEKSSTMPADAAGRLRGAGVLGGAGIGGPPGWPCLGHSVELIGERVPSVIDLSGCSVLQPLGVIVPGLARRTIKELSERVHLSIFMVRVSEYPAGGCTTLLDLHILDNQTTVRSARRSRSARDSSTHTASPSPKELTLTHSTRTEHTITHL